MYSMPLLFYEKRGLSKALESNENTLPKKRKTLLDAIKREFGGHAAVRGENAGLHIILGVKSAPSEEWLTQKRWKRG